MPETSVKVTTVFPFIVSDSNTFPEAICAALLVPSIVSLYTSPVVTEVLSVSAKVTSDLVSQRRAEVIKVPKAISVSKFKSFPYLLLDM